MLTEKYMDIKVELPDLKGEEGDSNTYYEEVEVPDSEIRHYIDTYLSAEDVLDYAKQIDPESFSKENGADIDLAYDILINEFDEHDDIEDIKDLNEYIQELVYQDYEKVAAEKVQDDLDTLDSDEQHRYWGL
jgi:hypothetical protein